ncbi:hypothetical protein B5F89_04205 [Collinsella sp. An307]|nr:hypothetical protein B5F89_04205 [Collinsella sp. An307]
MFQFPGLPSPLLCVQRGDDGTSPVGFSHSGTPGSKAVCASPGPIAACRALRRLPAPRHPPCALHILPPPRGGAPCVVFRAFPSFDNSWMSRSGAVERPSRDDATPDS